MIIKNGNILNDNFEFINTDVKIDGNKISGIGSFDKADIDATDCYVVPGFIDTHMHGGMGEDFNTCKKGTYEKVAHYKALTGTTTIISTISAAPTENLLEAVSYLKEFYKKDIPGCALMEGIHLEGPFFSEVYKGAHANENIRHPDLEELQKINECSDKTLKIITLAPELPGADKVIKYATDNNITVSIGHTDASFKEVENAMKLGATQGTHLYNAMRPMKHRDPGTVGGLLYTDAKCELICDFFHVAYPVVKLTYKIKGKDKINLITDSTVGAGYPDGEYFLLGRKTIVKDRKTYLEDGTINGGTSSLLDCVKNLVSIGIPLEEACLMASKNPAETLGIYKEKGSITVGKTADLLILDKNLDLKYVILRGNILSREF